MSIFTSIAVPVQWFNKRRGLASGITVAGSGIGGAALAPLNRFLISQVGFRWALRIMGLSFVVIIFSVMMCIRTRFPIGRRGGPIFDFSLFKEPGFATMYFMVSPERCTRRKPQVDFFFVTDSTIFVRCLYTIREC